MNIIEATEAALKAPQAKDYAYIRREAWGLAVFLRIPLNEESDVEEIDISYEFEGLPHLTSCDIVAVDWMVAEGDPKADP